MTGMAALSCERSASDPVTIEVRKVDSAQELEDFRTITAAYLEWLGEDLGFQGVQKELASLPGSYAPNLGGCVLLAYECQATEALESSTAPNGTPSGSDSPRMCVGAVALRRLEGHTSTVGRGEQVAGVPLEGVCEMKRLFVLPGHHRRQVGRRLVERVLREGAALGYQVMVLDTLERLSGANRLYASLGFQQCERYNDCPLPGVLYFARQLRGGVEPEHPSRGSPQ